MYYRNEQGQYLGVYTDYVWQEVVPVLDEEGNPTFDAETGDPLERTITHIEPNAALPAGAIKVAVAPADGRQTWGGEAWAPLSRRVVILDRLAALDGTLPRLLEDLVTATGTVLHGANLSAYTEKQALRAELAGL